MEFKPEFSERPWGNYTKFLQESGIWIKRIEVNPGGRLSLQKHMNRSERWDIISGKGIVVLGNEERSVQKGDSVDIPVEVLHRIWNTGDDPLVFIEIAYGDNLTEDDIIRVEDDYSREDKV